MVGDSWSLILCNLASSNLDWISFQIKITKFFNVKDGSVFFTTSFSLGFHSLLNQIKRKPSFLVLEDDYPSISESIISKGFEIIYVKNDAFVEKNIENAIKKYKPNIKWPLTSALSPP